MENNKNSSIIGKFFNPLYGLWGIEGINDALPIYIRVCRNVGGKNVYREYQRQIIGNIVRFENAETNDVCILFGGLKDESMLDNLRKCYKWIFNVDKKFRTEKIYVEFDNEYYEFDYR